ncbi:type III restriction endonuclease subunit R [Mannheimia granulomatis]|uniref:DEAD/DEAH box helicase family protein n=1 Tax=Mannheimia granulomatis TaxID=85402 RepID=UPI00159DEBDE|nr:DEAD/DEAH box helicase family protein [Mannheimia granulomatis]QLB14744.1 type III restriction endonuclease subunit R [Mannheimia granulomatis]
MNKTLFEVIENRKAIYLEDGDEEKFSIPEFITKNLKYDLFEWQKSALENFLIFENTKKFGDFPDVKNRPTHLLFNMATGAGKTLMMAALILYYYEKGYRHFLFFVNQNNIVDKTEDNFVESSHGKFLFQPKILQNDNVIPIKKVETFSPNPQGIEIKFTSIQKLYNDVHIERENQTILADLNTLDIVMLGDEAHHLNAETKKGKNLDFDFNEELKGTASDNEIERKGWEHLVLSLLLNKNGKPSKNVLLEFTATLPENAEVQKKYADKIITKFALKEFLQKGYTKEINLISSTLPKKERVLHALLFAWYRHQVALKYGIANFKPVMLFRSKTIDESKQDFAEFADWVERISAKDFDFLTALSTNLGDSDNENEQGKTRTEQALCFMQENHFSYSHLAQWVTQNYQSHNVIITNSQTNKTKKEKTDGNIEKLLNNLEATNNPIRAIFTVDRLTEGWDVLNLFDIVRLYEGSNAGGTSRKSGKTPAATVSEKQLIGRGVRYFPFAFEDTQRNKRRFDNNLRHELRVLEELFYYTFDEKSRYISELKAELRKDGYIAEHSNKMLTSVGIKSEYAKNNEIKNWLIWANKREKNPFAKANNAKSLQMNPQMISYQVHNNDSLQENYFSTDEEKKLGVENSYTQIRKISEIEKTIFDKALHIKGTNCHSLFRFDHLQQKLDIQNRNELQKNLLANWSIEFLGLNAEKDILAKDKLDAVLKLLSLVEQYLNSVDKPYIGTRQFTPKTLYQVFGSPKRKSVKKEQVQNNIAEQHAWYLMDNFIGDKLEADLVTFIAERIGNLQEYYHVHLVRNEEVYKIYNFDDGEGFQPDFLLLLKQKKASGKNSLLHYQIFIEPKGEHLVEKDSWKEAFLQAITRQYGKDNIIEKAFPNYRLIGLPFYLGDTHNEFKEKFDLI